MKPLAHASNSVTQNIMRADELKKLLHAVPFKPFTVYMASEKAFEVPHHDFALLTPSGRTLIVASNESAGVDMLDVPLISRFQLKEHAQ